MSACLVAMARSNKAAARLSCVYYLLEICVFASTVNSCDQFQIEVILPVKLSRNISIAETL